MRASSGLAWVLTALPGACLSCVGDARPASISATLSVAGTDLTCASIEPVTTCTITGRLEVAIQETSGRDVSLQSIAGTLWDTRGMQDMHASPPVLSAEDIRDAAGSNVVSGNGSRKVPYSLGFTIPQLYILGPLKASVQIRGVDGEGNVTEATCDTMLVAPVR